MIDTLFTNGVIAVKEKALLGDKLLRMCEGSADDALRALTESGFGSGATGCDVESLCAAEESALDAFIREYGGSAAELAYLLAPRDFHNAKAITKATLLHTDAEKLLAPEGLVPVAELSAAISGNLEGLPAYLRAPAGQALSQEGISGAEVGAIFDAAMFGYLKGVCRRNLLLKKLLAGRADRTNILTAMRAQDESTVEKFFVTGGALGTEDIKALFAGEEVPALKKLNLTEFYGLCAAAKSGGLPFTAAERALESFEAEYFLKNRYELSGRQPFLYYVFRRRAEISNARIILVCLGAGMKPHDVAMRLRAV